jgi:hypothetical protein
MKELIFESIIANNYKLQTVKESDELSKVKTIMLVNDYSQLGVETKDGLKGISWKSISKAELLNQNATVTVKDCLEDIPIILADKPLTNYAKLIAKKEYIFVKKNESKDEYAIVTTYDMTIQFNEYAMPFLDISFIELRLKDLLAKKKLNDQKKGDYKFEKPESNLSFGSLMKVLYNEKNWEQLEFSSIHKEAFIEGLNEIRKVRNKLAHFDGNLDDSERYSVKVMRELVLKMNPVV